MIVGGFDEIDLKKDPSEPYRRFIQQFQQTGTDIRLTNYVPLAAIIQAVLPHILDTFFTPS